MRISDEAMNLGTQVVDRGLLDRDGQHGGKVDDLVLEFADEPDADCPGPEVVALLSGPTAMSQNMSQPMQRLVRLIYRFIGLRDPHSSEVPWSSVASIDVVVHLNVDRSETGWTAVGDAVNRRIIARTPRTERKGGR